MRNSLNARNGIGSRKNVMFHLFQGSGKELVRNAKHKAVCILHHLNEIWNSDNILRKLMTRKIRKVREISGKAINKGYFTFSWSVLIISESLRSPIISSYTHILISFSKHLYFFAFFPRIMAKAEALLVNPNQRSYQFPLPIIATRSLAIMHSILLCLTLSSHILE